MSREVLIATLVEVFYEYGYDGATLSVISQATGLGKASLYHHFPGGKAQMAAAVLEHSDRWGAEQIGILLASDASPADKIRRMLAKIEEVHTRPQQLTLMNVFTYGNARHVFGAQVGERIRHWLANLSALLVQCGLSQSVADARALDAYIRLEGGMVLARTLNDLDIFRQVVRELSDSLSGIGL